MTSETSTYQRLPGKKKGFLIGYHTLWQGSDHLLQINSRFGVEDYKRFYFTDIQAIITRKTGAGRIQNFFIGALTGLFSLFAVTFAGGWSVFNAIIAGVMLVILLINLFKGPSCETYLLTAVQTEKLHSLHRLKITQPVMNQLRSIIEQQQGRINPETFEQQSIQQSSNRTRRPAANANKQIRKAPKYEKGRVHLLLFALLIFDGLIVAAGFLFTHVVLTLLGTAVMMLMGICVVVALVKQHESSLKRSLRTLTWAALGYVCFSFMGGYIISMVLAFKNRGIMPNQWELFKMLSRTTPWESPLMMTIYILALSGAAFIGIPGLFMLKNPQHAMHPPSGLPATQAPACVSQRNS